MVLLVQMERNRGSKRKLRDIQMVYLFKIPLKIQTLSVYGPLLEFTIPHKCKGMLGAFLIKMKATLVTCFCDKIREDTESGGGKSSLISQQVS